MESTDIMASINWIGILVASVSAFVIGGIWYGPLFGKAWSEVTGITDEMMKQRNQAKIFGLAFLLNLVMTTNLAMFLGPGASIVFGAAAGFATGLGWIAAMLGVYYLFEGRPLKLWLINGGYGVVALTVMGVILGALS